MQPKLVTTSIVALAIALGACGYGSDSSDDAATSPAGDTSGEAAAPESGETTPEPGEAAGAAVVQVGQTDLGEVLTDAQGLTLYGLTDDVDRVPTCYDDCANTWPPLLVESGELPAGLDPQLFSVAEREDGTWQLVAGNWPLYTFSGDSAPGDTNGQGSGGVWFAVAPDGQLIQDTDDSDEADDGSTEPPTETPETTEPESDDYDDGYGGYDEGATGDGSSETTATTEAPSDEGYDSGTDDGYGSGGNDDTGDGYDGGGY